eukprot:354345-Chlamydomonas_euryale.AAC.4
MGRGGGEFDAAWERADMCSTEHGVGWHGKADQGHPHLVGRNKSIQERSSVFGQRRRRPRVCVRSVHAVQRRTTAGAIATLASACAVARLGACARLRGVRARCQRPNVHTRPCQRLQRTPARPPAWPRARGSTCPYQSLRPHPAATQHGRQSPHKAAPPARMRLTHEHACAHQPQPQPPRAPRPLPRAPVARPPHPAAPHPAPPPAHERGPAARPPRATARATAP